MKQLFGFLVGGAALAVAVQSCSTDPALYLGGPAGPIASLAVSSSRADVRVGSAVTIGARGADAVGNTTADTPTFSSCDGSVVSVGTATPFGDFPVAAQVAAVGLGVSCVTVTAGGFTETIAVNAGPAGVRIVGDPIVGYDSQDPASNGPFDFTVEAFDAAGGLLTGTTSYQWSAGTPTKIEVDPATGTIVRTKGLGSSTLRIVAPGGANDQVTITVAAPAFTGTVSQNSGSQGDLVTLTRAAGAPAFDAGVTAGFAFGAKAAFIDTWTADALTAAVPILGATGRSDLVISKYGPNLVDRRAVFTSTTASLLDQYSPGNIDDGCNVPGTIPSINVEQSPGGWVYLAHTGSSQGGTGCLNGGSGFDHWFSYTTGGSAETGVVAYWLAAGDNDIYVYDAAFTNICAGFSGASNNELGCESLALAANSTYYIAFSPWSANSGTNNIRIAVNP